MTGEAHTPWWHRLADNPALVVTLAYLLVSFMGLAFSWALLQEFGINVFSFADVTDFLMAAFREPMTFVLASSALLVGVLTQWLAGVEIRWLQRRDPKSAFGRRYLRFERRMKSHGVYFVFTFLLYSVVFISRYAIFEAEEIRQGRGESVVLQAADDAAPVPGLLLGATSRFVFLYRPDTGQAEALPQENILRIRPVTGPPAP